MFDWFDLDEAAAIIKDATGKQMGARDLLRMAFAGELKVSSVIPGWVSPGVGDLVFYGLSGDSDARGGARMTSVTDGFFRHLEAHDFQALRNHGRLPLAGKTVVLRGSDGTEARWVIGPEAPNITLGDLRVSAAEVARIEAELEALKALHQGNDPSAESAGPDEVVSLGRQRQQERDILEALRTLGYDPLQLPRPPAGTPGPKAGARAALPKMTSKQFDKAWERLRGFRDIQDAE